MRKPLHSSFGLAISAACALALGACAYDPYYYGVSGSYSTGYNSYGDGYGYGNSGFSTSLFVSTGDPRWGYDPMCYSYYDYSRRCYYDPYLYGYYPMGYRPPIVIGAPHPHGYRHNYCPPPSRVSSVTLVNYSNRESAYRNSNYSWARQIRQQPLNQPRGDYGGRQPYQQPRQAQQTPGGSSGYWGNRSQSTGGSSPYQPAPPRSYQRPSTQSPSYQVPTRPAPVPDASPYQNRIRPETRPQPSMNQPRPARQFPSQEVSRPPQPRVERSVPAPVPVVREAPAPPPAAEPPASPPTEVRGLGEGGDRRGRSR